MYKAADKTKASVLKKQKKRLKDFKKICIYTFFLNVMYKKKHAFIVKWIMLFTLILLYHLKIFFFFLIVIPYLTETVPPCVSGLVS